MTVRNPRQASDPGNPSNQPYVSIPRAQGREGYTPTLWERVLAAVCAVAVLVLVFVVILRKTPFADQNQVVLVRIVLSLAVSIIGAVIPGFLQVSLRGRGIAIRAGGALALFVITYFFSPKVLPFTISNEKLQKIEESTNESRSQMGRIVTKFSSFFLQAVYELPQDEPDVKLLKDSLAEISRKVRKDSKQLPQGLGLSYSYSANDQKTSNQPIVSVDLDHILERDFIQLSPKLVDLVPLITFLKEPSLRVAINRVPRDQSLLTDSLLGYSDPPDLHLFAHDWPVDAAKGHFGKVILDPRRDQILVSWNGFDYPEDKWATSLKVVSIQDLDHAQLVVMLSGPSNVDLRIDKVAAASVPVWVNLKFDNNFVSFVDMQRLSPVSQWQAFTALFPPAQTILDGKASHSLDPAHSWGF